MGLRAVGGGRKPKSTQQKKNEGNPGKRPLNENEPQYKQELPEAPVWLTAFSLGIENYNTEGKVLNNSRVMTEADWGILAMRSYIYSQLVQLALDVKEEGRTISYQKMDSLGNEILESRHNPKARQIDSLLREYRTMGSLLGLDPSSRSRLSVIPQKIKSDWDSI